MRYNLFTISFFISFILNYSDGGPELSDTGRKFGQLYPGIQIVSIRITEDEKVMQSFTFRYRKLNNKLENEIGIQFMQNQETNCWEPRPLLLKELP